MDPANYGGVKGKLPSSVLYGEVTKEIRVESNDREKQDKLSLVCAFISRKVPKRAKRAKKRETRKAVMMKRRRKRLRKLTVMARLMRWRS